MVGASLFFGNSIITPAISVLSAVEGLQQVTPAFEPYIVPITLMILIALFSVQRFGTGAGRHHFRAAHRDVVRHARAFPAAAHIADDPAILWALNPYYAIHFLISERQIAFLTIGAVFLAVTGAEALYVDLGHFGRRPIVTAWLAIVFPSLLLNYFGQGAFVLAHPSRRSGNPFFEMQADWALLPVVILATIATVIASQAVISGAYSLTQQAVRLNILPRMQVRHTSESQLGQIYMPQGQRGDGRGRDPAGAGVPASSSLASAYGISVTGEMLATSILLFVVMRRIWRWALPLSIALVRAVRPDRFLVPVGQCDEGRSAAAGCRSALPLSC